MEWKRENKTEKERRKKEKNDKGFALYDKV
jgi:hypothetical protein